MRDASRPMTHNLCVVCLGVKHARSALEGASCAHCDALTVKKLCSRLALFFGDEIQASAPRSAGPATAEAVCCLHTWGLQLDLAEELGSGLSLSQSYVASSNALPPNSKAHLPASSSPGESMLLGRSSSKEAASSTSPMYGELLNVMTCATTRLSLDWSVERQERTPSRLDECLLAGHERVYPASLPFLPDLHEGLLRFFGHTWRLARWGRMGYSTSRISLPHVSLLLLNTERRICSFHVRIIRAVWHGWKRMGVSVATRPTLSVVSPWGTSLEVVMYIRFSMQAEWGWGVFHPHHSLTIQFKKCLHVLLEDSDLTQTHLNQLIKIFSITRNFQAGVLGQVETEPCRKVALLQHDLNTSSTVVSNPGPTPTLHIFDVSPIWHTHLRSWSLLTSW